MKGSLLLIAGLFAMVLMVSSKEGKVQEKTKEKEADVDKKKSESQEEDGDRLSHSGSTDGKYRK